MIKLYFIRHGATEGNLRHRYTGRSDEPLCPEGIKQLEQLKNENIRPDRLFVSPMLRTVQSAQLLFPGIEQEPVEEFRETDFGIFEGKTAEELRNCPEYDTWIKSMCRGPIPGGESVEAFKTRCCSAFKKILPGLKEGSTAVFLLHGGVIMAILEAFAEPERDFYDYHIANGRYIFCVYENAQLKIPERN